MRKAPIVRVRRWAVWICCIAALLLKDVSPARSGVRGSVHDFTSRPIAAAGLCGPCHDPHGAAETGHLWPRSLAQERSFFNQQASPAYVPRTTLLCYDCHDDNATTLSPAVDNEPPRVVWESAHEPQDTAFTDDTAAQGGSRTGYYELINGDIPGGPTPLPAAGSPTGGHYWKSEPTGTPDYQRGDKIACGLCHDPHGRRTGTNQAFFVTAADDGASGTVALGNGLTASDRNDLTNPNRSRNGTGTGREMCGACHGYSNAGTPVRLWGVTLPAPPPTVPQHSGTDVTPCTLCHPHNRVAISCSDCHGFPPLLTQLQAGGLFLQGDPLRKDAESYPGGAGAHQRHKDALGDAVFRCEICHGPETGTAGWHNQGNGVVSQANVDIIGQRASWDPNNSRITAYSGANSAVPVPDGYEFAAKGGDDQRCSGLACHGSPPDIAGALNWTDDMVDGDTPYDNPAAGDIRICEWCHDATPAVVDVGAGPIVAPNVVGAGNGSGWGAAVNGHGLSGAKYDRDAVGDALGKDGAGKNCGVCHDARYKDNAAPSPANVPYLAHFDSANDSAEKRLKGANGTKINGLDAADADAVCAACHQNAGPDAGTQVSTHGNDFAGNAEGARGSLIRSCRQCHDVHGANWNNAGAIPRNLHMVGRWVDANNNGATDNPADEAARVDSDAVDAAANITSADAPVVFVRRGTPTTAADDSFDDGFDDGQHESVCVVCHRSADMNPLHGGSPVYNSFESTALAGTGHNPAGADCTTCHPHDADAAPATADAFAPSGTACAGCHGSVATGQYWPDGSGGAPAYVDDLGNAGSHTSHVTVISRELYGQSIAELLADAATNTKQKAICAFCHPDPGGGGHSVNAGAGVYANRVDVWFDGQNDAGGGANYFQAFTVGSGTHGNDAGANGAYDPNTLRCSNVDCHYQKPTPANGALGWNGGEANPTDCETCHFTRGVVDAKTYPTRAYLVGTAALNWADGDLPDAHLVHVAGIQAPADRASKSYPCSYCHLLAGYTTTHVNGDVEVSPAGSPNLTGDESIVPTAAAVKYGAGADATCTGIYCHGGDFVAGTLGTDVTPVWNDYATGTCGACHNFNVRAGYPSLQPLTQGAHGTHLSGASAIAYGPPSTGNGHPADCTSCHGFKNPGAVSYCAMCHGTAGTIHLADPGNNGYAYEPSRSHVEGAFEVDFENQDRGWNDVGAGSGWTGAGTLASLGIAFDDGTDICNRCHSTDRVNGAVGATLAKENWETPGFRITECLLCHNETVPAWSRPVAGGFAAPGKQLWWASRGHGLPTGSTYPLSPNSGAGADCPDCHDANAAHLRQDGGAPPPPPHTDRLIAAGNALCNGCHDGPGPGSGVTRVSTHANTSGTMLADYTPKRAAFELNCAECHDAHGTPNIAMINAANPDGPLVAPRVYNGTTDEFATFLFNSAAVAFTDNTVGTSGSDGVGYADTAPGGNATKICQTCHTLTGHYQYNANDGHIASGCIGCHRHDFDAAYTADSQDGFMPKATCEGCHSGSYPLAPNVMGDGVLSGGDPAHLTPKPYDDGTYGFNVNGHGRDSDTSDMSHGNPINVPCSICHDISVPTGKHLDGVLDGRAPSAFNVNPFHLKPGFFEAPPGTVVEGTVQGVFDDYCYKTCHQARGVMNMRHQAKGEPEPNYVQMGTHGTFDQPMNAPPPEMFYDANITWLGGFNGPPNFAVCVSCHDPHGTNVVSPNLITNNNRMMIYRWESPPVLCSRCHI